MTSSNRTVRTVVLVLASVVALNGLFFLVDTFYGAPTGKPSSSFATIPEGVAAYAELLQATGHRVEALRTPLSEAHPVGAATLIVLAPRSLSDAEAEGVERFARAGGRLVLGGPSPEWLGEVLADAPSWSPEPAGALSAARPVAELGGARHIVAEGPGVWRHPGSADELPTGGLGSLLLVARVDRGTAYLLADVSPLQNRSIGSADNAAFALGLAGGSELPVYFAESVHGYTEARGLAALPGRWRWTLGGLLAAALLWMWSRARRLGPPQPEGQALGPPRVAFVHALATTLARTRRPDEAMLPVRSSAQKRLIRRAGLARDAGKEELMRSANAFGLDAEEISEILDPNAVSDPLVLGRAFARLSDSKPIGGANHE